MDYSSWTVRLETYDTRKWPGDAPQYIKDLVEAGLVYSGEKDIVFCFKCGVVISCWHEDDSPLDKHENMSPLCPYLQERNATKCALSLRDADVAGMGFPQASRRIVSLEDCERASYLFDWVPGHGVVYVKCSLLNKENMPDINNCRQNTSSMLSGNGLSSVPRCVELAKECAFVRELDTAGGDNVGVDARSSSPENVKTSASLLEGEAVPAFFSRPSLHRILSQESDPGLSESLESSKKLNVVLPSRPLLVTPTSCDAQGFGETNGESSCAQMSPFAQTSSSAQMSPCSQMSPCAQTPHAVARSPTYALVMPHGDLSEISKRLVTFVTWPVHSTMEPVELAKAGFYYLGRDDCVKCYKCGVTIRSWEPSDEAWAEHKRHSPFCELVIQKTREDLGMVQDYHFQRQPAAVGRPRENPPLPPLRSSLQPLLMPSPTSVTLRPSPRLMPAEFSPYQARSEPQMRPTTPEPRPLPPVFSRSPDQAPSSLPGLRVASPRSPYEISAAQGHYNHGKEDSFRVSAHPKVNNAVHAVRSVESSGPGWTGTNVNLSCSPVQTHAALPCAQFSSTKLNDAVMPPLPLPRYGLAGSHSCNYTDLEIDRLLDLGLLRADIEGTLRDRLALCGQSFQSLDDFAAAALFYQERKTLAGSPWCVPSEQRKCVPTDEQRCLSTEERKRVLTEQLNVRAAKSPEIPCSSPPEPSDSQACKICMDAFVSVLFIPCGHLVTCATCAETLKLCPICRSEIRSTHKAFLS